MGGGAWSSSAYDAASKARIRTGTKDFGYDHEVKSGRATGIHADLDPKKVAGSSSPLAGQCVRESRDSDEHPNSLPIVMIFDVTGSMGSIPMMLQKKLVKLMDIVIANAGIADPQILVGAVGDSTCDNYPLQVGQFESDNKFDEQLRNIILEGGGGGQVYESYGLAYRFAAYHTATDSFEKRGKKGYFFMIGDEAFWPTVTKEDVTKIFGVQAETDESVEELYARASEQWEIFHLFAMDGSYAGKTNIHDQWKSLLSERFIKVEDSSLVCEVVAGAIHMLETAHDLDQVVSDVGVSGKAGEVVRNALISVSSRLPAKVASGSLPPSHHKGTGTVSKV